jgi:hypothetical protein
VTAQQRAAGNVANPRGPRHPPLFGEEAECRCATPARPQCAGSAC